MWTIIIIIVILFFIFYRAFKKQEIENIQIKNSIENDIDEGQKALKSQNYVLALDIFKSIFSKNYTINNEVKASILLKMATCASKMKNTNECIAFLNEAERYNPNEIDIYLIRSAELLQKKLINQRDIELIENDLQQYSKMNIHNTETIKKFYDLLKIRKQEVFSPKKEITQIQNPIFQVTRFKAFEDSYIFKQQQGEEYLGIRNFEKALNCFEYAYKLFASQVTPPIGESIETLDEALVIKQQIVACYFALKKYDKGVILLDEILDKLQFLVTFNEMRAFGRLSSENLDTVRDLTIIKEDLYYMKITLSSNTEESFSNTYYTLRRMLGHKLINNKDQSWRNDPQLVEIANELIEK